MFLGQCSPDTMLGATDPGKNSIRDVDPETGNSKFKFEEVIISNESVCNGLFMLKRKIQIFLIKKKQESYNINYQKLTIFLRCRSRNTPQWGRKHYKFHFICCFLLWRHQKMEFQTNRSWNN